MEGKVEYIDIERDGEFLGITPILKVKGKKPRGFVDDSGMPELFESKVKAKEFLDNRLN